MCSGSWNDAVQGEHLQEMLKSFILNDDLFKDKHMSENLMHKLLRLNKLDLPIGSDT